ncbi:hypothetical protein NYE44_30520 [Paenibacillus sp. FSL L8-0493]|uniref:hypothetical protein n=1 Tax=Paenibacillus sp. FSL L8-0493 TaxID=2975333 RepID=UPI0030FDD02F
MKIEMRKICLLVVLIILLTPTDVFASVTGSGPTYTISSDEYIAEAPSGTPGTVQLKTSSGATKWVIPSNILGNFNRATIRTGRNLSEENYITVTFGDGYSMTVKDNAFVSSGYLTIQAERFAEHPSRGLTIKYTHDGEKDVKVYLASIEVSTSGTGTPTPTPAPTIKPTAAPTVKPSATPSGTSSPNPSASATVSPSASPNPTDPGGGTTDPGSGTGDPEECTAACQAMIDQLKCPQWDEYMSAWADMIRGTYPPPPNWYNVAEIMRDTIVPSMGQEMVNRSPEIAKIIADEFQSREKAVSPPPTISDFKPTVPRISDTPKVSGNLNDNVPNFQPDYSEDKGFVIPDPASIQFNDNSDKGYEYQPIDSATPTFSAPAEPSATDKGYKDADPVEITPPKYVGGRYTPEETAPPYKAEDDGSNEMPNYSGSENSGDYMDYKTKTEEFKEYEGK